MILKRLFDIFFSLTALLALLPLLILTSFLIFFSIGSPIFFVQDRAGKNGKPFKLIKFRTMINSSMNENGKTIDDDKRLTRLGEMLRKTSIDELPGFINVFKGEMSVVGPRPLLVEYVPLYNKKQIKRLDISPGITGWAQINGRNSISWKEKFDLDIWYVENRTFKLDMKIIFLTVKKVLFRENISPADQKIMPKFQGNEE